MNNEILTRLADSLNRITEGRVSVQDEAGTRTPLRELGLDSLALLNLLVAVEDEFGIEWQPDTPPEALRSLETIAEALFSQGQVC